MREADFEAVFLARRPLLDVRAPTEFADGALPEAVNVPLLDDEQRRLVGAAYKNAGPEAAVRLGRELIRGDARAARVAEWKSFFEKNPNGALYCFRGGLRSDSVAAVMRNECGLDIAVLEGGYKAGRRFLREILERVPPIESFLVLSGRTGTGKTDVLRRARDWARTIDLERLAQHRGSAFGRRPGGQPSTADFENRLAVDVLAAHRSERPGPILMEDESRQIGKLTYPSTLFHAAQTSPLVLIDESVQARTQFLLADYVREDFDVVDAESARRATETLGTELRANLLSISKKLGGARAQRCLAMMEDGLKVQAATGSLAAHAPWVEFLLREYYDPAYDRHLERESSRVIFRGDRREALEFLVDHTKRAL